jgi:hypothetical protein
MLQSISQEVYRRYPAIAGRPPKVQPVRLPANSASASSQPAYLLIYQGQGLAVDRRKITTLVRVVVDRSGKILKMTTSR